MTILFNRGKGLEYNVEIKHADYIDPLDILDFDPTNYQCFSWINVRANLLHLGSSNMGGHFISAIRSEKDNKPRTYNDGIVDDRNEMKAREKSDNHGNKEMSYVWFTDTMTLNFEIDTILENVQDSKFRDAILTKFLSLGVLDAQAKDKHNKNRQMIFAYVLMYAYVQCMDNKNLVRDQLGQVNQAKSHNFDKYLSDFICAAFNMIANVDDFKFEGDNCKTTTDNIRQWKQDILNCAQDVSYVPIVKEPVAFNVYKEDMIMNNNINNINNNVINNFNNPNLNNDQNNNNIINNGINNPNNMVDNTLNSRVSEEKVLRYNSNAIDSPKYNPNNRSKFFWWQLVVAGISVVAAIVSIIFEAYIILAVLVAAALLVLFAPKLLKCCFCRRGPTRIEQSGCGRPNQGNQGGRTIPNEIYRPRYRDIANNHEH